MQIVAGTRRLGKRHTMKLLKSIFGIGEARGRYPDLLVDRAIDRAVEGTDPRLALLPGHRKRLREPVIRAIDHVVALVDAIAAPVPAGRADYSKDPRLGALFSSATAMLDMFSRDAELSAFLAGPQGRLAERVTALLLAERRERTGLGMDLVGDQVRRDVRQVTVNFDEWRLLDPAADEAECRRQLMRRAFDHLLTLALGHIAERRVERADLTRERDLLRRRLADLKHGGWSFEADPGEHPSTAALEADLARIDEELAELGAEQDTLKANLGIVIEVLDDAPGQLWGEPVTLHLDAMNIARDATDPSVRGIELQELHNRRGDQMSFLLLSIAPGDVPVREDLITAAQRYLY
jgi:hypothetical protein